jgi:aminopeptidase N
VAVSDFNMGAMENKGLNIFNTRYVLADQDTATDGDFDAVEGVIGHEYFHNWSGNRITCRDWFQLSLKEGFTVLRDQLFSADMGSEPVKRIEDVRMLRGSQLPRIQGRWRIRSARIPIRKSAISIPRPSITRAPR